MKECLVCKKEVNGKRNRKKFCSDICRATFHQNLKEAKLRLAANETDKEAGILYRKLMELLKSKNNPIPAPQNKGVSKEPPPVTRNQPEALKSANNTLADYLDEPKTEKTFQQHMNDISELQYEEEFRKKASEIEMAANLTRKTKDLLLLNMRQSKL